MSAATVEVPLTGIVKPGVYPMDAEEYHADPVLGGSLSVSGAKDLLPPSCPALFKHRQKHRVRKQVFDFGHAAHKLILGAGADIVRIEHDTYRKQAAQDARDAAYEDGLIPVLPSEFQEVSAMAAAVRRHPVAAALLNPERGMPEQCLFWKDAETGVWLRSMIDWLPFKVPGRRSIIVDYKTAKSASPEKFARDAADYGYHQQAEWYMSGVMELGLADDVAFVFIVQEKTPPYLVTVVELDPVALKIGHSLNRKAIHTYAECRKRNEWPGYSTDVELVCLPGWYERLHDGGMY